MQESPQGLYMAFDYGSRYIGIANGNSLIQTASPLSVATNNNGTPDWQQIDALIQEWLPVALLVGIPVHMDGTEQPLTGQARGFRKRLAKRYNLPTFEVDERLTTKIASDIIKQNRARGKRRKTCKADLDKIAAALILEKWFEQNNEHNR
jgi:putative Holliday junction resolvase